jgi:hypothetical protein
LWLIRRAFHVKQYCIVFHLITDGFHNVHNGCSS